MSAKLVNFLHDFGGYDGDQRYYTRRRWEIYLAVREAAMAGWHEVVRDGAEGLAEAV